MSTLRAGPMRNDGMRIATSSHAGARSGRNAFNPGLPADVPLCGTAKRIPGDAHLWMVVGAVVAVAGTLINIASGAWLDPFASLLHGGILGPIGMALLAVGLTKRMIERRAVWLHRRALGPDFGEYACSLENLLRGPGSRATMDWLTHRTGWTRHEVVHTLAILCDRGRIQEEFDPSTGEYRYRLRDLVP